MESKKNLIFTDDRFIEKGGELGEGVIPLEL